MFGLGEGKLELFVDKETIANGDKITGRVKLTVNSQKSAKGLKMKLIWETSEMTDKMRTHAGKREREEGMDIVTRYEKKIDLAPEGVFTGTKEYPFSFETAEIGTGPGNAILSLSAWLDVGMSLGFSQAKAIVVTG